MSGCNWIESNVLNCRTFLVASEVKERSWNNNKNGVKMVDINMNIRYYNISSYMSHLKFTFKILNIPEV